MKKLYNLILISFCTLIASLHVSHAFSGVIAVGENHYIAKMPGQEIYLVAERLTDENRERWKRFVEPQSGARVAAQLQSMGLPSTPDGSSHFLSALKVNDTKFEQWVVCATRSTQLPVYPDDQQDNILMFMTVNTTPQSLVTTHMGIAGAIKIVDGFVKLIERPKGISMDLHSFAAKVMLLRNPTRRFMINIPVLAMAQIILKEMPPGSVHFSTLEESNNLNALATRTFEDYLKLPDTQKTFARQTSRANKELDTLQADIHSGHLKSLIEIQEDIGNKNYLVVEEVNGKFNITLDEKRLSDYLKQNAQKNYNAQRSFELKKPGLGQNKPEIDLLQLIHDNPPIIHGGPAIETLEVMDPKDMNRSLFKADKSDPIYGFLFLEPFRTFGPGLNYVAVDLDKLAEVRPLDTAFQYQKP